MHIFIIQGMPLVSKSQIWSCDTTCDTLETATRVLTFSFPPPRTPRRRHTSSSFSLSLILLLLLQRRSQQHRTQRELPVYAPHHKDSRSTCHNARRRHKYSNSTSHETLLTRLRSVCKSSISFPPVRTSGTSGVNVRELYHKILWWDVSWQSRRQECQRCM